jgi:tetratricopeptide (TPR) repeat protein
MKKIITLLFLSFVSVCFGQTKYSDIDGIVTSAINSYTEKSEELRFLGIVKNNFDKSHKINKEDFTKDNVGIAFVLSQGDEKPTVFPAKYSFDNELVNISAVNANEADIQDYVQKYLHTIEAIGSTNLFRKMMLAEVEAEGKYVENNTEIIVDEPLSLSFVRGNSDWMYIVSIDNTYNENPNPRIIIYAFKISLSGEDIFNAGNSVEKIEDRRLQLIATEKAESHKFPLYHDVRTDEIRDGLAEILKIEPYKLDKNLTQTFDHFNKSIDRYNIKDYVEEFKFLLSANISKESLEKHFQPFIQEEVFNVKHLSAHALADFYFGSEEYDVAIDYYKRAIFEFPYEESSGTGIVQDAERIIYDIAKCNYYSNKKNEAYGFLIGLIIDSQRNEELATKTINEYINAEKEDKKKFKKDVDKALKTIKKGKNYTYSFTFRDKEIFFFPMMPFSQQDYEKSFKISEFYKSL